MYMYISECINIGVNYNTARGLRAISLLLLLLLLLSRRAEIIGPPHCPRDRYFVVVKLIIKLYRAEAAGGGATERNKRSLHFFEGRRKGRGERERERDTLYEAICQSSHALPRSPLSRLLVYRPSVSISGLWILQGAIGAKSRLDERCGKTLIPHRDDGIALSKFFSLTYIKLHRLLQLFALARTLCILYLESLAPFYCV